MVQQKETQILLISVRILIEVNEAKRIIHIQISDNTIGAVGFVPRSFKILYPVTLAKCDEDTGEPLRNSEGFCMETQPGEPGVFIGKINTKHASRSFAGYADKV